MRRRLIFKRRSRFCLVVNFGRFIGRPSWVMIECAANDGRVIRAEQDSKTTPVREVKRDMS